MSILLTYTKVRFAKILGELQFYTSKTVLFQVLNFSMGTLPGHYLVVLNVCSQVEKNIQEQIIIYTYLHNKSNLKIPNSKFTFVEFLYVIWSVAYTYVRGNTKDKIGILNLVWYFLFFSPFLYSDLKKNILAPKGMPICS